MIKVGVIGATGYTGAELVRLLANHPQVEISGLTSQSYCGQKIAEVYPSLLGVTDLVCEELDLQSLASKSDVIFICLPHGHSVDTARELLAMGKRVIDLGADFRLKDSGEYRSWYNDEPAEDELLEKAVYGLPELNRDKIKTAKLIANPGCYPTSSILALAPVLSNNLIDLQSIVIDAKSGVSGAGRSLSLGAHYTEVNEGFKAYKVGSHRHTPEIEQEASRLSGVKVNLSFTPHLVPMNRGILATVYATLREGSTTEAMTEKYQDFYGGERFIHVFSEGKLPQTNWVAGTNNCHIAATVDQRTKRLIVVAAIDNLVKGAAGQAIQNMNLMFNLNENMGLDLVSRYI